MEMNTNERSLLIENERLRNDLDYWKSRFEKQSRRYNALIAVVHKFEDNISDYYVSLGER